MQKFLLILIGFLSLCGCALFNKPASHLHSVVNGEVISIPCKKSSPVGIRIKNMGNYTLRDIKILRKGQFDFTTIEKILVQCLSGKTTEKEKVFAIYDFVTKYSIGALQVPPDETEPHDPVKFFSVYGYGICDDHSKVFYNLCKKARLQATVCQLSGHIVSEGFYEGEWHMFDTNYGVYYHLPNDDKVLNIVEVAKNCEIVRDQNNRPISGLLKEVYSKTKNPYRYENYPITIGHSALFLLAPNENVSFYKAGIFGYYGDYRNYPAPAYANAVFSRTIDFPESKADTDIRVVHQDSRSGWEISWDIVCPFVSVKSYFTITSVSDAAPHLFINNRTVQLEKVRNSSIGDWIYRGATGQELQGLYHFPVRITIDPVQKSDENPIRSINIRRVVQYAKVFCPYLTQGDNNLIIDFNYDNEKIAMLKIEPVYPGSEDSFREDLIR